MKELLPYFSLAVAVGALIVATIVALRAGRWRLSDDAKALDARISAIGGRVGAVETNSATADELAEVATRVTKLEAGMLNVATKADVAKLTAEIKGLETAVSGVDAGVNRIESHLMGARV